MQAVSEKGRQTGSWRACRQKAEEQAGRKLKNRQAVSCSSCRKKAEEQEGRKVECR
jgi:hypothetical protein